MALDYYTILGVDKNADETQLKKGACPLKCTVFARHGMDALLVLQQLAHSNYFQPAERNLD